MFGRKQTTETRNGRYGSKRFTVPKDSDALSAEIERAMNAGDAWGWHQINVTQ